MTETGSHLNPWDDPEGELVETSKNQEEAVHNEEDMPAFGHIIRVVDLDQCRNDVRNDIGRSSGDSNPGEPGDPSLYPSNRKA